MTEDNLEDVTLDEEAKRFIKQSMVDIAHVRRIAALREPTWVKEDRAAVDAARAEGLAKGWLSGPMPGDVSDIERFRAAAAAAAEAGGEAVLTVWCRTTRDGEVEPLASVVATPHGLLFTATAPHREATRAVINEARAMTDARVPKVEATVRRLVLLDRRAPVPELDVPIVHCRRHGTFAVDRDVLLQAARNRHQGSLRAECPPSTP